MHEAGSGTPWLDKPDYWRRKVSSDLLLKKYLAPTYPFTHITEWDTLRPQSEETIRLRRERMQLLSRRQCLNSRTHSILEESKLFLSFSELMHHLVISKIVNANGLEETTSAGVLELIKSTVLELGSQTMKEETEACGSAMATAFAKCGIILPLKHSSLSRADIFEHSCAFFENYQLPLQLRRVLAFDHLVSCNHIGSIKRLFELYAPDTNAISVSKTLAEGLNVVHLTLSELDLLEEKDMRETLRH